MPRVILSRHWARKGANLPKNVIRAKAVAAGKKARVVARSKVPSGLSGRLKR